MHDFEPDDILNVIVVKNSVEALYEEIGHKTPTTIKGVYNVFGMAEDKLISCVIYDPQRKVLYKRKES